MSEVRDGATIAIVPARGRDDMASVRALFEEYQRAIGVDLCFQGFDEELRGLPGAYAPPGGCLLLARDGADIAGVVGVRPLAEGRCEIKRLYVRPRWRGGGLGRRLAEAAMAAAREAGHGRVCLDTLPMMARARELYRALGFKRIPAYYENPVQGTLYMEREL